MSVVASRSSTDRAIFNGRPPFASRRMTSTGRGIWRLTSVNSVVCAILEGMFSAWPKDTGAQYDQDFARKSSLWSAHQSRVRSHGLAYRRRHGGPGGALPAISKIMHGQAADAACRGGDERPQESAPRALIPPA